MFVVTRDYERDSHQLDDVVGFVLLTCPEDGSGTSSDSWAVAAFLVGRLKLERPPAGDLAATRRHTRQVLAAWLEARR